MKQFINLFARQVRNLAQHHEFVAKECNDMLHELDKIKDRVLKQGLHDLPTAHQNFLLPHEEIELAKKIKHDEISLQENVSLPKHVSVGFIVEYLETSEATFYRRIHGELLNPIFKIGSRPYYLLSELAQLMKRKQEMLHQRGAWTFAKLGRSNN